MVAKADCSRKVLLVVSFYDVGATNEVKHTPKQTKWVIPNIATLDILYIGGISKIQLEVLLSY